MKRPGIAIYFYGAQYGPQIGKHVRMLGEWCEIVAPDTSLEYFENAKGIIHSGSRYSVHDKDAPIPNLEVFDLPIPQLGFCYGQQLMQHHLGGEVVKDKDEAEYGVMNLHIIDHSDIFEGLGETEPVLMSHRDVVVRPALGHVKIGYTENSPYAALKDPKKKLYGFQFHPEVYDTPNGREIIKNFLDICGCKKDWSPEDVVNEKINYIREKVDGRPAIMMTSGGKDSMTTALLSKQALDPDKLFYLHVKTGLERENEAEKAQIMLEHAGITENIHIVDASDTFFRRLKGIHNDIEKRHTIGDGFIYEAENLASNLGLQDFVIIQGSLMTDIIESSKVFGTEDQIKPHHNLSPKTEDYRQAEPTRMVEPLFDMYKDDSKRVGRKIGTPEKVISDEPMPGPGFGVRTKCIPGNFVYYSTKLEPINTRVNEITGVHGLKPYVRPYRTVGVQGDSRTNAYPVIIEGEINEEIFGKVAKEIPNSVREISRVWYLLEPRKVDSIQLQRGKFITRDRIDRLRRYEDATKGAIKEMKNVPEYTQFPLFLIPDSINGSDELLVFRPFFSRDYMTGKAVWLPEDIQEGICHAVDEVNDEYGYNEIAKAIEGEGKPPGTTELE